MNLEAHVRLVGDSSGAKGWAGQLIRISESVDPTRDTLGLVISVDNPYEGVIPGKRPPLLKGMYTSVELFSPAKPTLILPRKAVHQGRVYIANDKSTLDIQAVNILFKQGDMVVLNEDKDSALIGKKIIISDVIPVIQGLPLKTIEAEEYQKNLALKALGKATPSKNGVSQ
jgi:multidrug efflux pump subunit AcrA (membrane-fusion protein)